MSEWGPCSSATPRIGQVRKQQQQQVKKESCDTYLPAMDGDLAGRNPDDTARHDTPAGSLRVLRCVALLPRVALAGLVLSVPSFLTDPLQPLYFRGDPPRLDESWAGDGGQGWCGRGGERAVVVVSRQVGESNTLDGFAWLVRRQFGSGTSSQLSV